jgi:hypothetical protein
MNLYGIADITSTLTDAAVYLGCFKDEALDRDCGCAGSDQLFGDQGDNMSRE